jgi:bleomycin hydrolase
MDGTLAAADLDQLRKDFSANPVYRLAQNAVTRVTVDDVAINREIVSSIDHSLSTMARRSPATPIRGSVWYDT